MTTRIPSKLRKAVGDPFKGIPGIGRASISFDGQDHLSITVPGWSPTFHERDLQLGMDVERAAVGLVGLDCRHDGSPVSINQQALFDHLGTHAQRFAEAQREISGAATAIGIKHPIPLKWRQLANIGHVEVDAQALDDLVDELGVKGAAARIAWIHGQLEGNEDDTDGYFDGDEGQSEPSMDPRSVRTGDDYLEASVRFEGGSAVMNFDIFLEDDSRIGTDADGERVRLADHLELGAYFELPAAMLKEA